MILRKGTIVSERFEIDGLVREPGGTAEVYHAHIRGNPEKKVVLKIAIPEKAHEGLSDYEILLIWEAEILKRAEWRHPGIVQIYPIPKNNKITYYSKAMEVDGHPQFFVMEPLFGDSLTHNMKKILTYPVEWRMELFYRIAITIAFIHAKGWGHRDIKPDNIVFRTPITQSKVPDPVLIDYALCTNGKETPSVIRKSMTMDYASHERVLQSLGHAIPDYPKESDIWSLAIVLYELITGKLPHRITNKSELKSKTTGNEIQKNIQDIPANIEKAPVFSQILREMVHENPNKRPTIEMIIQALDDEFPSPRIPVAK